MRHKNYIFGLERIRLEDGSIGYKVNIIPPDGLLSIAKRISGGVYTSEKQAIREAKKYINKLYKERK